MFFGSPFLHYRLIRGTITAVARMDSVTFRAKEYIVLFVLVLLIIQKFYTKRIIICYKVACFFPQFYEASRQCDQKPGSPLSMQSFAAQGWLRQAPELDLIYR